MISNRCARRSSAFTLVELLVSTVVLMIILLMLVAMVNQTSIIWRTSSSKVEQFRAARIAFESINRNLSQATLNSYYDYVMSKDPIPIPTKYIRQSDLRFVVGKASELVPTAGGAKPPLSGPTHAVFFHAPAGFVSGDTETQDTDPNKATLVPKPSVYSEMRGLLNTWGYFIEYGSDYNYRPTFLNTAATGFTPPPERYRYRLMEFMVPADQMQTYWHTSIQNNNTAYTDMDWFDHFLTLSATPPPSGGTTASTEVRPVHMLAENIVGLILRPQLSPVDQKKLIETGLDPNLAPSYSYNSGQQTDSTNPQVDPKNQLPPIVQVTMIAIDEASATRVARNNSANPDSAPSEFAPLANQLFQASAVKPAASQNPQSGVTASSYTADLNTLLYGSPDGNSSTNPGQGLVNKHIAYRVFTTNVSLRAAKWSRD